MHTNNISCLTMLFTFCLNVCFCRKYHNYTLLRGIPVTKEHLDYYKNLSEDGVFNFWREPGLMYNPVEFVVSPDDKPGFLVEASRRGLYLTTIMDDIQRAFDMQTVQTYIRRDMSSFNWNNYYHLSDIYKWLKDLARVNPAIRVESIGKTEEKRDIMAVRILLMGSNASEKVVVEGGIHAREWISVAFVTYLIHEIIHSSTSENKQLREMALKYEWLFVPVLNPDGYEYTMTTDRLWRKNRSNFLGVDLNRNFNIEFGTVGVSHYKDSNTYCGPSAFSEKETKAFRDFMLTRKGKIKFYLAFHSYGQYMIIPYAYSLKHEENFDEVEKMCKKAATKISSKYRTKYSVGTAYDTVGYATSGVSGCWVKKKLKVPYVVTFELRDTGFHGFGLPTDKILPTCRETLDGITSLLLNNDTFVPKPKKHSKLRDSAGPNFILDNIVIFFNIFLFIIVRFD